MMCVCVGYGCVFFLWVCGILDHNSCSSQVTVLFSRTYLAFLPRHDYHTPSTLATRNISIIPKWNWSNVPEMSNLHKQQHHPLPPYSSLSHTCFLFHIRVSSLYPPIQCRFLLSCRRNPLVESFPLSQPFVGVFGSLRSDISSVTCCWEREGSEGMEDGEKKCNHKMPSHFEIILHYPDCSW